MNPAIDAQYIAPLWPLNPVRRDNMYLGNLIHAKKH